MIRTRTNANARMYNKLVRQCVLVKIISNVTLYFVRHESRSWISTVTFRWASAPPLAVPLHLELAKYCPSKSCDSRGRI